MNVAEAVGSNCKEELLCCPLGSSKGGDDENNIDVSLHSLQRDSDDCGPPDPRRSPKNKHALTDSY